MYHIKSESILFFLEDKNIRLPRFQRKQTWNNDQNFKLVISVFKDFPIGVTIINKQTLGGKNTRWLLDGRQRRNALEKMYQDPENIYVWAKKYLGIKNTDQPIDIQKKFWEKIESYLNDVDETDFNDARNAAIENGESEFYYDGKLFTVNAKIGEGDDFEGEFSEEDLDLDLEVIIKTQDELIREYNDSLKGNLDELLFVIQTVHTKTLSKSGFTAPFDLRKIIKNLSYSINGNQNLSGQLLKTFISEYLKYIDDNQLPEVNSYSLLSFYKSRYNLAATEWSKVSKFINLNWQEIEKSIEVERIVKSRLFESHIGIIETTAISATDSQMIFTLINQEGTKLLAVEILSAKPSWNVIVKKPSTVVENEKALLYQALKNDAIVNTVRWDYPATLYSRLSNFNFLLPKLDYNISNQLDRKLTLGFKILSGIYQNGIKKEDIDKLSYNPKINWESDIDSLVADLQEMGKVLSESNYFVYLNGLGKSYLDITSDAVALSFLFTCYSDFKRKGKPTTKNSKNTKKFVHNAIILADKLMFEYITFKWRGSSDGKISKNISEFASLPDKFIMIEDQSWINLFKSINNNYKIDDSDITFGLSKSLIYHTYSIMSYNCQTVSTFDIDHIIPQSLFDSSSIPKSHLIKNALFNLCPLPSKSNAKKNDKKLNEITDNWLIGQIEIFSEIKRTNFAKFSDVQKWEDLRIMRSKIFEIKFIRERLRIVNN